MSQPTHHQQAILDQLSASHYAIGVTMDQDWMRITIMREAETENGWDPDATDMERDPCYPTLTYDEDGELVYPMLAKEE